VLYRPPETGAQVRILSGAQPNNQHRSVPDLGVQVRDRSCFVRLSPALNGSLRVSTPNTRPSLGHVGRCPVPPVRLAALVARLHGRAFRIDVLLLRQPCVRHPFRLVPLFGAGLDITRRVFSRGRIGFLVSGAKIRLFAHYVHTLSLGSCAGAGVGTNDGAGVVGFPVLAAPQTCGLAAAGARAMKD
jgi:hypothetical protein